MAERSHCWTERRLISLTLVYLSIYLSYLSIYLSIHLSIYPSIHLFLPLSIYRSIDRSIDLSIYRSIDLSVLGGERCKCKSLGRLCLGPPFKGGGGPPPTLRFPPGPPLKPGLQHRRTTRKRQQPHMHFHPPRLHTSPPQPKSRPALKLDNVRLLKNFVSFTLTTAMNNVVARTLRRTALQ